MNNNYTNFYNNLINLRKIIIEEKDNLIIEKNNYFNIYKKQNIFLKLLNKNKEKQFDILINNKKILIDNLNILIDNNNLKYYN